MSGRAALIAAAAACAALAASERRHAAALRRFEREREGFIRLAEREAQTARIGVRCAVCGQLVDAETVLAAWDEEEALADVALRNGGGSDE